MDEEGSIRWWFKPDSDVKLETLSLHHQWKGSLDKFLLPASVAYRLPYLSALDPEGKLTL